MIPYWSTNSCPSWLYLPYFWSRCLEMSSWSDRLLSCMFPDHSLEYPQYPSKVHLSQLQNTLTIKLYFDESVYIYTHIYWDTFIEMHCIPDNDRDVSTTPTVVWTAPSVEIRCACAVVVSFTGEGEAITSS